MNWLLIEGHVGNAAEIRSTPTGKQVTGFSVASNQGWGENKRVVWFRCSWWGDRGVKLAEYLVKGTHVLVQGEIDMEPRIWTGRTGEALASLEVTVRDVRLLGSKQDGEQMPTSLETTDEIPW